MKKILILATLLISIFSIQFISASDDFGCGLTGSKGDISIDTTSGEICEQDIAFRSLYLAFSDIVQREGIKYFIDIFVDVPEELQKLAVVKAEVSSLSIVFDSLSYIIYAVGIFVILYTVINELIYAGKNGKTRSGESGNLITNSAKVLFSIILIAPVGGLPFIQVLVLTGALAANIGGNYLFANYLESVESKTSEAVIRDRDILSSASDFSSKLVQQELCINRTRQNILNNRLTINSAYNHESPDIIEGFTDNDVEEAAEVIHHCSKYYVSTNYNPLFADAVNSISLNKPPFDNCDEFSLRSDITNFPQDTGYSHSCGRTEYIWPDLSDANISTSTSKNDMNILEEHKDLFEDVKSRFGVKEEYSLYKSKYKSQIKTVIFDTSISNVEKQKKLNEIYNKFPSELYSLIKAELEDGSDSVFSVENQRIKNKLISAKALIINNTLLGATENDVGSIGAIDKAQRIAKMLSWPNLAIYQTITGQIDPMALIDDNESYPDYVSNYDNDYDGLKGGEFKYGLDFLRVDTINSALQFEKAHCYENWEKTRNSRKTINVFNENLDNDLDDFLDEVGTFMNFECLRFNSKLKGFEYIISNEDTMSDLNSDNGVINDKQKIKDLAFKFKKENYIKEIKEAQVDLAVLTGYAYGVKKATAMALKEVIKESSDNILLIETRQEGWFALGSKMIKISSEQSYAQNEVNNIISSGKVVVPIEIENDFIRFENINALIESEESVVNLQNTLIPMRIGKVLLTGGVSIINDKYSDTLNNKEDTELRYSEVMLTEVSNLLFSPLDHVKKSTNINVELNLIDGLEACSKSNDCISTDYSPINGLSMMGQELSNGIINIYMLKGASDSIAASPDIPTIPLPVIGVIAKLVNLLKSIAEVSSAVLDAISPALSVLLFIGILFGYVLPFVPYLMVFMGLLSFIVDTIIIMFSSPLLVFKMAHIDSNGESSFSFKDLYMEFVTILLKPFLITVGVIVSWSFFEIALYLINSTIFNAMTSIVGNEGIVEKIVSYSMIMVIYLVLLFIASMFSFGLILRIGDEVLNRLGAKHFSLENAYKSMKFEAAFTSQAGVSVIDDSSKELSKSIKKTGTALGLKDKMKDFTDKLSKIRKGDVSETSLNKIRRNND